MHIAPKAVERCGGELVYLALIEPGFEPPSLVARQRIVDALEIVGPYISAFALAPLGDDRVDLAGDRQRDDAAGAAAVSDALVRRRSSRRRAGCAARTRAARTAALSPCELGDAAERLLALRPETVVPPRLSPCCAGTGG